MIPVSLPYPQQLISPSLVRKTHVSHCYLAECYCLHTTTPSPFPQPHHVQPTALTPIRPVSPLGPSSNFAPRKSGRIPPRTPTSLASTCALAKNIGWMPNAATPFLTRRNTLCDVNNKAESGVDERDKKVVFDMTSCGERCRRVWVRLLLLRRGVGPELCRSISWGTYS